MEKSDVEKKQMILDALARQGLSQVDLANMLDRGLATVQTWVSGTSTPELTPEEALEMCRVFGCSLEDLASMFPGRSRRRSGIKESHRAKLRKRAQE